MGKDIRLKRQNCRSDDQMRFIVLLLKKTEYLSALSIRLVYLTGKANVPLHPKHLINREKLWYRRLLTNKMTVLDAGSGSGQHSLKVAPFVKKVIGIDKNPENLDIARQSAKQRNIKNVFFKQGDLEKKINLPSSSIDFAILFDVLEHIVNRQQFLKEVRRILGKDGKLILAIPNIDTDWKRLQRKYGIFSYSDPDHKIEYSKQTIAKELEKAGFRILKVSPISYDTPYVGFIDLAGGISLALYKKLAKWKEKMLKLHPENASGFQIVVSK